MITVSQIAAQISTKFTSIGSGKVRIEMSYPGEATKIRFFSERNAAGFACAMQSGMVTRIANELDGS